MAKKTAVPAKQAVLYKPYAINRIPGAGQTSYPPSDDHPFGANDERSLKFREDYCWAADTRGIILLILWWDGKFDSIVVWERNKIGDQEWFDTYLASVGLEGKKLDRVLNDCGGAVPEEAQDPLSNKSEIHEVVAAWTSGLLFDISQNVSEFMWDYYKIPYVRSFALAITKIKKGNKVGIHELDFLLRIGGDKMDGWEMSSSIGHFRKFNDLSEAEFSISGTTGIKMSVAGTDYYTYRFRNFEAYGCGVVRKFNIDEFVATDKYLMDDLKNTMYGNDDFQKLFGINQQLWNTSTKTPVDYFYSGVIPGHTNEDLPPGKYTIEYVGGGLGKNGSRVIYNYAPPLTWRNRFAPKEILNHCKELIHFGGPIELSGLPGPRFTLHPRTLEPLVINQWVYDVWSAIKWNLLSTSICGDFGSKTRIFVERVCKNNTTFKSGLYYCLNTYMKINELEHLDAVTDGTSAKPLSIAIKPYTEAAVLVSPEMAYETVTYHDIADQPWNIGFCTWPSWKEIGINISDAQNIWRSVYDQDYQDVDAIIQTGKSVGITLSYGDSTLVASAICEYYNYLRQNDPLMCQSSSSSEENTCETKMRIDEIPSEKFAYKRGKNPTLEGGAIIQGKITELETYSNILLEFTDNKDGMLISKSREFSDILKEKKVNQGFSYIKTIAFNFESNAILPIEKEKDANWDLPFMLAIFGSQCRMNYVDLVYPNRQGNLVDVRYSEYGQVGVKGSGIAK
jgi:hypothetical protein